MDWRDLIDERRKRALAQTMPSATRFATTVQNPQKDDGGFFGGLNPIKTVTDTVGGVAGFFGNMVKDVVDTAGDAVTGIKDVVEGSVAANDQLKKTEEYRKKQKELTDKLYSITGDKTDDATWNDPKVKDLQNQINKLALENGQGAGLTDEQKKATGFDQSKADQAKKDSDSARKEIDESQKVDATKTAAASAETFLNVGTLGIGGLAKGAVKQGAKVVGKEILKDSAETVAKNTAKKVAEDAAARTATGAAKRIGTGAFEGAALGGSIGFLDPYAKEGKDADAGDAWRGALTGAALGGAVGGAIPLIDRNVRAGVREMPGAIRDGAQSAAETAQRMSPGPVGSALRSADVQALDDHLATLNAHRDQLVAQGLSENAPELRANAQAYTDALEQKNSIIRSAKLQAQGGYIKNPFYSEADNAAGDATNDALDAATQAQQQLAGNETDPFVANYINEEAAKYGSPKEYLDSVVDNLWQENKKGKGVETGLLRGDPNSYDVTGRWAVSNNSPFYQRYYREYNSAPTKKGIRDMVEQDLTGRDGEYYKLLDSADENGEIPYAKDIYQQLVDREQGFQHTMEQGPPPDLYSQFASDIGQAAGEKPAATAPRPLSARKPGEMGPSPFDSPDALQRALARGESQTNNAVDFVDTKGMPSGQGRPGVQQTMDTATDPYAGNVQDLNRLALPQGEIPKPLTPNQAKRQFSKTGEAPEFVNTQKSGSKPIELGANVEDGRSIATRQTKGGKIKPFKFTTQDEVDAIRAIAADDTSNKFTMTKTPEMNLEAALSGRGGANSKEFRVLDGYNQSIRQHTAEYTDFLTGMRDKLESFQKDFGLTGKAAADTRQFLEADTREASEEALKQFVAAHGKKAGQGLIDLRNWWRETKDIVRSETNDVIKQYAGEDRMMGDLGATYVPRVYKSGTKGFKDAVLDVAHAGMDKIGGENGMFNLKNGTGYLEKTSESSGGILRNAEGIPLNSEFAKPNTTYLSAAQKRTANSPIKDMEDPLTSMMRYFEATGRAKYYTPDIAKGQELRDAIQLVNNESGNLRQMYKSFEDQVNSLAGKTSRIDRPFVDSAGGAKFVDVASKLQSRVSRSTILGSASSVMAQTGQLPLVVAENGGKNFAGAMTDMMKFVKKGGADPMAESALMKSRYPKYEDFFTTTKGGKINNKGTAIIAKPFRLVEHAATELAWRASYRRAVADGLAGKAAVQEADRIAAKLIGERSPGARAALYESKALSPVSAYTLEVNQLYQVAKTYFKNDPKRAAKLVGAIWVYNQGYEALTGNKLNADPLQATLDAGKILTDQNYLDENGDPIGVGERLLRAGGRLAGEAIDATPLGGPVVGQLYPEQGFKIPFGGGARVLSRNEVFGDTNFGRYGGGTPLASGLSNPLLLTGIPGMAQLQRSVEGANAVNTGASITPGGDLRFAIDPTQEEMWRAILLGQYGTEAGRQYMQQQNQALAGYYQ